MLFVHINLNCYETVNVSVSHIGANTVYKWLHMLKYHLSPQGLFWIDNIGAPHILTWYQIGVAKQARHENSTRTQHNVSGFGFGISTRLIKRVDTKFKRISGSIPCRFPVLPFSDDLEFCRSSSSPTNPTTSTNMSNVEAINLSGDEGAVEISKPSVAAASGSKAAPGNTQRKVKPNTGITKRRQRKLTSPVWDYFTILDDTNEKGDLVCLCNRCGVKYIAESRHGTGNMLRHGKSCKGHTYKDVGQFILKIGLNGSLGTRATTYKHEEFRELLAIAIAKHNLPLQFVEYEASLQPEVEELCKKVVKMDVNVVDDNDGENTCDISSAQ
ncbi:hypothetical protein LXL04_010722 [Taraxacum kok-saghyz]